MVYLGITPPPPGVNIATFNSQSSVEHFFWNFPNLGIFHPIFLRFPPNSISSICILCKKVPIYQQDFWLKKEVIFTPAACGGRLYYFTDILLNISFFEGQMDIRMFHVISFC